MPSSVETRGLTRRFGAHVALHPLDLDVGEGEIFGLLGSNGAGKTTLIQLLTTLLAPSGGAASILGHDVVREADAVRRLTGTVSERIGLYSDLTVEENLRFFAKLHGLPAARARARIREELARVALLDARERRVGALSFGMRKRAEIACALLHEPRVVFMDEATAGVDPQNVLRIRATAQAIAAEGRTILWTTHALEEPLRLCRRVGILSQGVLKAVGAPRDLAREIQKDKAIEIRTRGGLPPARLAFLAGLLRRHQIPAIVESPETGVIKIVVERGFDLRRVLVLTDAIGDVEAVQTIEPSLEDAFLHHTSGGRERRT